MPPSRFRVARHLEIAVLRADVRGVGELAQEHGDVEKGWADVDLALARVARVEVVDESADRLPPTIGLRGTSEPQRGHSRQDGRYSPVHTLQRGHLIGGAAATSTCDDLFEGWAQRGQAAHEDRKSNVQEVQRVFFLEGLVGGSSGVECGTGGDGFKSVFSRTVQRGQLEQAGW
eukprot:4406466-Pleurochrysis_carterae.AAC.2